MFVKQVLGAVLNGGEQNGVSDMLKTIIAVLGCLGVIAGCLPVAAQESASPGASPAATQRALLNRYCVTCHNEKLKTAGLMLDKMDVEHVSAGADI